MNVSIIGTGYVGLVTGACLADQGHRVLCVDVDEAKVSAVNAGRCPIHEAGLPEIISRRAGRELSATTDLPRAVRETDLTLIAAPTPFDGTAIDLSFIRQVAGQIGAALRDKPAYHVVVVKSTVVPGTTDDVVGPTIEATSHRRRGEGFGLGMNPEFLSEGVAVRDFVQPDRIVLGGIDDRTRDAIARLYARFDGVPFLRTNNRTAEMIKYASNSLQATMISFANEFANLCEAVGGIDAIEVMRGVHAMKELTPPLPRAGDRPDRVRAAITSFLLPGCGFGGSCFPKDVKAIAAQGRALGVPMPLLDGVLAINADRPRRLVDLVEAELGGLAGRGVAVLGLAFKPGTDDLRESPAFPVIDELRRRGADVTAFDPIAMEPARGRLAAAGVRLAPDLRSAVAEAAAVVIVTAWPQFAELSDLLDATGSRAVIIDGRRMLEPRSARRYAGVGLSNSKDQPGRENLR